MFKIKTLLICIGISLVVGAGIASAIICGYISSTTTDSEQFGSLIDNQGEVIDDLVEYLSGVERRDEEMEKLLSGFTGTIEEKARRGEEITRAIIENERANSEELRELKRKIQALKALE